MRFAFALGLGLVSGLVATLGPAGAALGQRALGEGRALDSNLRVGSDGRNAPTRDVMREIRLRNAIVVGRAPGGLSFRGDVGYGAADDFRGELAEDDLFAFERDAILSGVTGRGVRNVEALQLQMQLTVGGLVGEGDFLPDPYIRRRMDATSVDSLQNAGRLDAQGRTGGRDPLEYQRGSLRSTSEFTTRRNEGPTLLRVIQGEEESQTPPAFEVATPLRSITRQEEFRSERRLSDLLQVIDRIDTRADTAAPTEAPSNRIEPERDERQSETYRSIVERLAERQELRIEPEEADEAEPTPEEPAGPRQPAEPAVLQTEPEFLAELRELRESLMRPQTEADEEEAEGVEASPAEQMDAMRQRVLESARRIFEGEAIEVETLAPAADERVDLYGIHMRRGQEQLAEGQWFAAEERFTSALGLRPGDPMAAVGRIHAQIGGGMFLSAGLNLQKLFRAHPELIKVRYDETLLPFGRRLDEIVALLNARLRGADDFSRGAALVKAYLGFQTAEQEWVREGLERMVEIDRERGLEPEAMPTVLREAWIEKR